MSTSTSITLVEYFNNRVAPTLKSSTANSQRYCLCVLGRWQGHDVLLNELSPRLVDVIYAADGRKQFKDDVYWALRKVWRAAAHDGFAMPVPVDKRKVERDSFANGEVPPGEVSLFDWFKDDYRPNALFGKSEDNDRLYRTTMRNFAVTLKRVPLISDLTDTNIRLHMGRKLDEKLSRHTVNGERNRLNALANYAAKKRLIEHFPTIKTIPAPLDAPVCWRIEQLESLIAACSRVTTCSSGVSNADALRAFNLIAWNTGERSGPLLRLKWEWLSSDFRWLRIPGAVRKWYKPATYKLKPAAIEALRKLPRHGRQVFPWGAKETFYYHYKKLLIEAGLPSGRRWKPQCIRRAFASYLEAAGHNATDALQHTSRSITIRNYIDPTIAVKTQASDVLPELKGGEA